MDFQDIKTDEEVAVDEKQPGPKTIAEQVEYVQGLAEKLADEKARLSQMVADAKRTQKELSLALAEEMKTAKRVLVRPRGANAVKRTYAPRRARTPKAEKLPVTK